METSDVFFRNYLKKEQWNCNMINQSLKNKTPKQNQKKKKSALSLSAVVMLEEASYAVFANLHWCLAFGMFMQSVNIFRQAGNGFGQ